MVGIRAGTGSLHRGQRSPVESSLQVGAERWASIPKPLGSPRTAPALMIRRGASRDVSLVCTGGVGAVPLSAATALAHGPGLPSLRPVLPEPRPQPPRPCLATPALLRSRPEAGSPSQPRRLPCSRSYTGP